MQEVGNGHSPLLHHPSDALTRYDKGGLLTSVLSPSDTLQLPFPNRTSWKKKCHGSWKLLGSCLAARESVQACRLLLTWAAEISHSSSFGFQNLAHSADFIFPEGFFEPDSFHLHSIATAELKHRKGLSRKQLFLLINVHCVRIGMRLLCLLCLERQRERCVLCSPLLVAFSSTGKGTRFPFLQMPLNVSVFFWARLNLQPDLHIVFCWAIITALASASWQLLGRGEQWSGHSQSQLLCRGFMHGTNWRQLAAFHPRREKTPRAMQPFLYFLAILQFPCQFSIVSTLLLNVSECLCTLLSHCTVAVLKIEHAFRCARHPGLPFCFKSVTKPLGPSNHIH